MAILWGAAFLSRHDLWAEPEPEKNEAAFAVLIRTAEPEIELEVETLKEDEFDRQVELLARCVEAEAGNQSRLGKQLVCDVILNRVQSESFPDGIEGVIMQEGQFAVVENGAINKAVPTAETWEAVLAELNGRIDEGVLYFRTGGYPQYGEPYERIGDHYFSK